MSFAVSVLSVQNLNKKGLGNKNYLIYLSFNGFFLNGWEYFLSCPKLFRILSAPCRVLNTIRKTFLQVEERTEIRIVAPGFPLRKHISATKFEGFRNCLCMGLFTKVSLGHGADWPPWPHAQVLWGVWVGILQATALSSKKPFFLASNLVKTNF